VVIGKNYCAGGAKTPSKLNEDCNGEFPVDKQAENLADVSVDEFWAIPQLSIYWVFKLLNDGDLFSGAIESLVDRFWFASGRENPMFFFACG
jgi:hypothetical protein